MVDYVQQLRSRGVRITRDPAIEKGALQEDKPYLGCLLCSEPDGQYSFLLALHEITNDQDAQSVARWALGRVDRMYDYGPEPDGWQRRSDGDLQLWINQHNVDPWLTEHP